jgi:hypothetical protein
MSNNASAKWILEAGRPDLIANWFKQRAFDARRLRETTETLVWGGLDENRKKPSEVLQALADARMSVSYLRALTAHAADTGHAEWSSDQERYRFVTIAVREGAESMSSDFDHITHLEAMVEKLIGSARGLTNDLA